MSFAKKYLELLEKFDVEYNQLKDTKVTRVFNAYVPDYNVENIVDEYQSDNDYLEDVSPCILDHEGFEVGESENWQTHYIPYEKLEDLNSAFEYFLEQVYSNFDLTDEGNQQLFINSVLNSSAFEYLLANFYLSCIESLFSEGNSQYTALKTDFPNRNFYPSFSIESEDLTHFESSRCW